MAVDGNNRIFDLGDATIQSLVAALKSPVEQVYKAEVPGVEEKLDRLYEAVNDAAVRVDPQASQDLQEDQGFSNAVFQMNQLLKEGNRNRTNFGQVNQDLLSNVANSNQLLAEHLSRTDSLWININQISGQAQRDIANAIQMAGCCSPSAVAPIGPVTVSAADANRSAINANRESLTDVTQAMSSGGTSGTGSSGGGGGGGGGGGLMGPGGGKPSAWLSDISNWMEKIGYTLAYIGNKTNEIVELDPWDILPNLREANQWRENLRSIIFETQGHVKENKKLEEGFLNMAASSYAAGTSIEIFNKEFHSQLQRGLKGIASAERAQLDVQISREMAENDAYKGMKKTQKDKIKFAKIEDKILGKQMKERKNVTSSALNTAQMLNMSVGETNELFTDWHLQLGLSANRMGDIGRHMQQVARNTGLTGTRLENALKSADSLAKSLKNTGSFDVFSAKNVTSMSAALEKYGITQEAQGALIGLTDRKKFFDASQEDQQLMKNMALTRDPTTGEMGIDSERLDKIISGTALHDPEFGKWGAEGLEALSMRYLSKYESQLKAAGVLKGDEKVDVLDATNMSAIVNQLIRAGDDRTASLLSNTMQNEVFIGPGTMERLIKSMQEAGVTTQDTIKNLTDKMNAEIAMSGENSGPVIALQKQIESLKLDNTISMFNEVSAVEKATRTDVTTDMDGAARASLISSLDKLSNGGGEEFLSAGMPAMSNEIFDSLRSMAKGAEVDFDKLLTEQKTSEGTLKNLLSSGPADRESAMAVISELKNRINLETKIDQDPVTEIRDTIRKMHNFLTGWVVDNGTKIVDLLGANGVGVISGLAAIGSAVAQLVGVIAAWKIGSNIINFLSGGAAAAPTAARGTGIIPRAVSSIMGRSAPTAARAANPFASMTGTMGRAAGGTGRAAGVTGRAAGVIGRAAGGIGRAAGGIGRAAAGTMGRAAGTMGRAAGTMGRAAGTMGRAAAGTMGRAAGTMGRAAGTMGRAAAGTMGRAAGTMGRAAGTMGRAAGTMGRAAGGIGRAAGGIGRAAGGIGRAAGGIGRAAGVGAKGFGAFLGKIAAPLQLLIGGIVGGMEAKENKRTIGEGIGLGMLTGDASVGSMFSPMLGIEKNSFGDKALGVAGAATYGGLAGAGIGILLAPFTAGISIPVAAAIGLVVGAIAELVKIFTEGTTFLSDVFAPITKYCMNIFDAAKQIVTGLWDVVAGIFTLDIERVFKGAFNSLLTIPELVFKQFVLIGSTIGKVLISIPSMLLRAIKGVFVDLPQWIMGKIHDGLKSLAQSKLFGPIFKPILEAFGTLKDALQPVFDLASETFNELIGVWDGIRDSVSGFITDIFGAADGVSFFSGIIGLLGSGIRGISHIIGFLISGSLPILKTGFEILGTVLKYVVGKIKRIANLVVDVFGGLWDVIAGIFTLDIGRIGGGINKIFMGIGSFLWESIKGLGNMIWSVVKMIWNGIKALPGMIWNAIKALPVMIWNAIKALPVMIWNAIKALPVMMWNAIKEIPGMMWNAIKEIPGMIWNGISGFGDMVKNSIVGAKDAVVTVVTAPVKMAEAGATYVSGGNITQGTKESIDTRQKSHATHAKIMDAQIAKIEDPGDRIKEIEKILARQRDRKSILRGQYSRDESQMHKDDSYLLPNWMGADAAVNAGQVNLKGIRKDQNQNERMILYYEAQLKDAKSALKEPTAAGSEGKSVEVSKALSQHENLQTKLTDMQLSGKSELKRAVTDSQGKVIDVSTVDAGAFQKGQAKEAFGDAIAGDMKRTIGLSSAVDAMGSKESFSNADPRIQAMIQRSVSQAGGKRGIERLQTSDSSILQDRTTREFAAAGLEKQIKEFKSKYVSEQSTLVVESAARQQFGMSLSDAEVFKKALSGTMDKTESEKVSKIVETDSTHADSLSESLSIKLSDQKGLAQMEELGAFEKKQTKEAYMSISDEKLKGLSPVVAILEFVKVLTGDVASIRHMIESCHCSDSNTGPMEKTQRLQAAHPLESKAVEKQLNESRVMEKVKYVSMIKEKISSDSLYKGMSVDKASRQYELFKSNKDNLHDLIPDDAVKRTIEDIQKTEVVRSDHRQLVSSLEQQQVEMQNSSAQYIGTGAFESKEIREAHMSGVEDRIKFAVAPQPQMYGTAGQQQINYVGGPTETTRSIYGGGDGGPARATVVAGGAAGPKRVIGANVFPIGHRMSDGPAMSRPVMTQQPSMSQPSMSQPSISDLAPKLQKLGITSEQAAGLIKQANGDLTSLDKALTSKISTQMKTDVSYTESGAFEKKDSIREAQLVAVQDKVKMASSSFVSEEKQKELDSGAEEMLRHTMSKLEKAKSSETENQYLKQNKISTLETLIASQKSQQGAKWQQKEDGTYFRSTKWNTGADGPGSTIDISKNHKNSFSKKSSEERNKFSSASYTESGAFERKDGIREAQLMGVQDRVLDTKMSGQALWNQASTLEKNVKDFMVKMKKGRISDPAVMEHKFQSEFGKSSQEIASLAKSLYEKSESERKSIAESSRSLDYERTASESSSSTSTSNVVAGLATSFEEVVASLQANGATMEKVTPELAKSLNYDLSGGGGEKYLLKSADYEVVVSKDMIDNAAEGKSTNVESSLAKSLEYEKSASEAYEKNIVSALTQTGSEATSALSSEGEKNVVAELSRALEYEKSASQSAENVTGIIAEGVKGEASSSEIDYSDTTRAIVNPMLTNRYSTEENLEQQKYGAESAGGISALVPGMDSINQYLTGTQAEKLTQIAAYLQSIDNKLSTQQGTQTIGAKGGGKKPMNPAGVELSSMSSVNPNWDLTYGDSASGEITVQGTG